MDTPAFLGYHANGQKGLEGAAKRRLKHPGSRYKKVQQKRCAFFVYHTLMLFYFHCFEEDFLHDFVAIDCRVAAIVRKFCR